MGEVHTYLGSSGYIDPSRKWAPLCLGCQSGPSQSHLQGKKLKWSRGEGEKGRRGGRWGGAAGGVDSGLWTVDWGTKVGMRCEMWDAGWRMEVSLSTGIVVQQGISPFTTNPPCPSMRVKNASKGSAIFVVLPTQLFDLTRLR